MPVEKTDGARLHIETIVPPGTVDDPKLTISSIATTAPKSLLGASLSIGSSQ
jgi:hypothetical protein